jgi:phenylacetate-CoA ligase
LVAASGPFATREQLANAKLDVAFARESWTLGASGAPVPWRDTRADLVRRAAVWREALLSGGVAAGDRVMLALPPRWAVGGDCLRAVLELDVLSTVVDDPVDAPEFDSTVLIATPTDALRLARTVGEEQISRVFVTGEPGGSLGSTRRAIEEQLGARCIDVYALTELGVVGWSCAAQPGGVHLDETAFRVEVVDACERAAAGPANGEGDGAFEPLDGAEVGELLLSTREQRDVMLRGYCTGDLVRLARGRCGCGSRWVRAEGGILGRSCERLAPRGVTLLPSQIENVVRRHPAVYEFAIVAYHGGEVAIRLEPAEAIASESDRARVAAEVSEDLKRSLGLRLQCDVVRPGSLGDQDAGRRARRLSRQ